ncbi:hypothetical protein DSO57_1038976, partial [Entomophthora muscae]
ETYPTANTIKTAPFFHHPRRKSTEMIVCRHFRHASAKSFYHNSKYTASNEPLIDAEYTDHSNIYCKLSSQPLQSNRPDELFLIRRETLKPSSNSSTSTTPKTQEKDNSACKILPKQEQDEDIPLLNFPPDYPWFLEYL